MKSTAKRKSPLLASFSTEREAGAFWDKHSLADFEEDLSPAQLKVNIQRRRFEIEIDEESFMALRRRASRQRKPLAAVASKILKDTLGAT